MRPLTGLERRTERFRAESKRMAAAAVPGTVTQEILRIRDQRRKPSCVGQAFAAGIEGVTGQLVSAVDLWTDARRRQGDLGETPAGTRAEYAIESLRLRGWSPYVAGEDARPASDDAQIAGLLSELAAYDKRAPRARHWDIDADSDRLPRVVAALSAGMVVCGGWGIRAGFYAPPPDTVLDASLLSARSNGHEMRIVGYDHERRALILQNSWGAGWSWCVSDGIRQHGCCLVSVDALEVAWDVDALEVVA